MNPFSGKAEDTAGLLLSFLAGETCFACGRAPGFLCSACRDELPWLDGPSCLQCAVPLPEGAAGNICGECLSSPPAFSRVTVPFSYEGALQKVMADIKFNGRYYYVSRIFDLLSDYLCSIEDRVRGASVVLPVPLSRKALLRRGYNQSLLIAREFGRVFDIPCHDGLLVKAKEIALQSGLSREKRFTNIKGAFSCKIKNNIEKVILIDDIITTTATIREAAKVLHKGGVNEIHVFAFCRTEL